MRALHKWQFVAIAIVEAEDSLVLEELLALVVLYEETEETH